MLARVKAFYITDELCYVKKKHIYLMIQYDLKNILCILKLRLYCQTTAYGLKGIIAILIMKLCFFVLEIVWLSAFDR